MEFNLTIDVEYETEPEEPMTRDYPGCPAQLEVVSIYIKGKQISDDTFYTIMDKFGYEIEQACWEEANQEAAEQEAAHAEHLYDLKTGR